MLRITARIRVDSVFRWSSHLIAALVEWLKKLFG
jgi:hypothetical protein